MIKILPCPQGPPSLREDDSKTKQRRVKATRGIQEKDFLEMGASEQSLERWLSFWPEEMGGRISQAKAQQKRRRAGNKHTVSPEHRGGRRLTQATGEKAGERKAGAGAGRALRVQVRSLASFRIGKPSRCSGRLPVRP